MAAAGEAAPPDQFATARLVRSTLIAGDRASQTGDCSRLRDLAAPEFQRLNDPARLAGIFAAVRERDLGLGRLAPAAPVRAEPLAILKNGLYRVNGAFPARPVGVAFEILFRNVEGRWRLFGISVSEAAPADAPTEDDAPPAPQKKPAGSGGRPRG